MVGEHAWQSLGGVCARRPGYTPLMASKYLAHVSSALRSEAGGGGRVLFGLDVQLLRLLLQLVEAALGIEVDGVLGDLALGEGAVLARDTGRMAGRPTYDVEALLDGLRCLGGVSARIDLSVGEGIPGSPSW